MTIQNLIIRYLLTPLSHLTGKLADKGRERLFLAAGSGIFVYFFLYHMHVIQWRYLYSFAFCSILLGLMILATIPKQLEAVKFKPVFALCWFGAGGLMLLSGLLNNTNYLPEALLLLVAYPIIFICWNNWDREYIFDLFLKLCKISIVIFFAASFLFAQITPRRYGGIFHNVNNCGSYLALAGVCLILEILYKSKSMKGSIVNAVLFSMCYGMITLTNSRSGKLALLAAVIVGVALYLITHITKLDRKVLAGLVGCVLFSTFMATCILYVFQLRQYLPLPYYDRVNHSFYVTVDWFQKPDDPIEDQTPGQTDPESTDPESTDPESTDPESTDPESTEPEFTEPEETKPAAPPDFFGSESFDQLGDNKTNTDGKTMDQISSGRLSIWKEYLKKLTLLGTDKKEPVYVESYKTNFNTAHMTVLEIAYESGIIAGAMYLLMNLISGITALAYAWKNRREKFALVPLMVVLAFGIVSVLSSANSSFNYILTFCYYLVLFPLIVRKTKQKITQ